MDLKRVILTVGILLSVLVASAQADLPWRKFSYFNNKGGLNDNLSTTEIEDGEATDLQNVVFDVGGAIKKRYGFTHVPPRRMYTVATGAVNCVTGITFIKQDNGNRFLFAISNSDGTAVAHSKAYSSTGGPVSGQWDYRIGSVTLNGSYSNNYQPSFCVASNSVIFTDGTENIPYVWNGAGPITRLNNQPWTASGSVVTYHKNQLFVGKNATFPSRVWFSELGDITSFSPIDFFDCETQDGSKIRGMVSAFDSLYIFKDKSIWRLSGNERDSFQLQKMVEGIGTLSPASIKVVNNYIYFTTAQNDIAIYDGAYTCKFISQKIRGTVGNLNFERAANNIAAAFSTYKYNDYDYYVSTSLAGSTFNNRLLVWDTQHSAWTKHVGINACSMCVGDNDKFQDALYFGDYNGYVCRYPSSNYIDGSVATEGVVASVAIAAYYQTKWFKYSDLSLGDNYWRVLRTWALSADDTVLYAECKADYESSGKVFTIDLNNAQAKWDLATWDVSLWGGESIIVGRNEVEKGTNMFQVKFSQAEVDKGFTLLGFENYIEPTADRI